MAKRSNGHLPPRRQNQGETPQPQLPPSAHKVRGVIPQPTEQSYYKIQDEIRKDLWKWCRRKGYNPWRKAIKLANEAAAIDPFMAAKIHLGVAEFLLPKLSSMRLEGEVEHHHTMEPLQVLFQAWEQEEAQERESLPPWQPPGVSAPIGMTQDDAGVWDVDEEGDDDGDDDE